MPAVLKTLDVSDGHSLASFEGSGSERQNDCLKRHKLLLLDSLLQEVCIESGSDGSLALSSLGLSVCLVSHNLLYSGLKKAHSKMKYSFFCVRVKSFFIYSVKFDKRM